MNILLLSWRDPKNPLAGGAEQVMHEHAKGWIAKGHTVTLFSSFFKGAPKNEILDGVTIIREGSYFLGVHFKAFLWYQFKKNQKFDLIVDQFHGIPFFTPLYIREPKLAVIQEVAREVWFLNHLFWPLNWIIGGIGYTSEPLIFLLYRHIPFMVGSESAKEDLSSMGISKKYITVIPHGVIIEKAREFKKEKIKTIIFLGALAHDKGIEDAIRSFGLLSKKGKFQFWIVGKGSPDYLSHLEKLVRDLNIEQMTTFWGFVSQSKKFELLKRAHIMVNPSVREGWGLVNIEANAMGTPVVSYKSPGLIDSVKDGVSGIFCENNFTSMADKAFALISNQDQYNKLSKSAIDWSNNFSWEKSRIRSLDLIKKVTHAL